MTEVISKSNQSLTYRSFSLVILHSKPFNHTLITSLNDLLTRPRLRYYTFSSPQSPVSPGTTPLPHSLFIQCPMTVIPPTTSLLCPSHLSPVPLITNPTRSRGNRSHGNVSLRSLSCNRIYSQAALPLHTPHPSL